MYKFFIVMICVIFLLDACAAVPSEITPTSVTNVEVEPTAVATLEPMLTATLPPLPSPLPEWERAGWTIVWHDEFDGPELDLENWNFDLGGHGWGNQEGQVYTDRPENIRIQNGMLVIEARKEHDVFTGRDYSSARIKTQELHTWQYGRVEARLKLPYGQGIWPAFWMLGDNFLKRGWPLCGEMDIMEFVGRTPDQIYATVHGPGYSGGNGVGTSVIVSADSLKNEFHTYAIEWEENEIRWYMDDQQYFKVTPEDVPGEWVFDHPFFIILNLAVGGRWPGYPDDTTIFPQYLFADYVRVYHKQ